MSTFRVQDDKLWKSDTGDDLHSGEYGRYTSTFIDSNVGLRTHTSPLYIAAPPEKNVDTHLSILDAWVQRHSSAIFHLLLQKFHHQCVVHLYLVTKKISLNVDNIMDCYQIDGARKLPFYDISGIFSFHFNLYFSHMVVFRIKWLYNVMFLSACQIPLYPGYLPFISTPNHAFQIGSQMITMHAKQIHHIQRPREVKKDQ